MSTSLGRLVLDMAANAAGFERDMQRISKSAQKELRTVNRELRFAQRDLDATRARVNQLAMAGAALGGLALAGTVRQFQQMSAEADRIGKLGLQLGISAEAVQELGFAAEQSGSDMEQLSRGLIQMQRNIQNATDGLSTQVRSFERMGISIEQLRGLSADQQFELIADALSQMEDQTQRNASALEIFGRSASNILPLLDQGSAGIRTLREQLRSTGGVLSQDAVDAAQQFNDALNVLRNQVNQFRVAVFSDLVQPLAQYADWLANTEQGQQTFQRFLEQVGDTAQAAGVVLGVAFVGALTKATVAMVAAEVRVARLTMQKLALNGASRSAAIGVTLFGRALSIATGPIGIITGLIATLGIGYLALRDDVAAASEEFDEFTSRIDRARESTVAFRSGQLQADLVEIGARLSELNAEIERLQRVQIGMEPAQYGDPRQPQEVAARVRELTAQQTRLRQSAKSLNDQLEALNKTTEDGAETTVVRGTATETLADSIETMTQDLQRQIESLRQEKIATIGGTRALLDYRIAKEAANGATVEQIREAERLRDAVLDEQSALDAATAAIAERQRQAEALAMQMRDVAAAFIEAATGVRIFNEQGMQAGIGAGGGGGGPGGFAGAFSSIGTGFAESIFNGQSISDAIESAFTGFGGDQLSRSAGKFFDDVVSEGLGAAFQNSKTQQGMAGGFALAIGQALQGNYVQAAFTAAGTALGGPIGGQIGSIIGALISQKSDPNFQIRGTGLQGREFRNLDTDEILTTALGQVEFGFRYIENGVQSQVMNALEAVDANIAAALRGGSLLEGARAALETFGASSREFDGDLEALLEKRLQAVVRTLDQTIGDMILSASSLEGQLDNLQSVMAINRQLLAGATLGLPADFAISTVAPPIPGPGGGPGGPITGDTIGDTIKQTVESITASASGFNSALQSVGEGVESAAVQTAGLSPELAATVQALVQVRIANEPLIDTFNRTVQVLNTLDTASALLGARFGETRMEAIAFGADLAALFGDDAGAVAAQFNRVFEAFYTEAERAEAEAQMAAQEASRLLSGLLSELGMEFSESMLTQGGFRELFESLSQMGTLTAAQAAVLLQAGGAVADYIDAQTELNGAYGDGADAAREQAEALAEFMAEINDDLIGILAPSYAEFNRLAQAMQEQIQTAQELGASEEQMMRLRRLHQAQMSQFVAGLQESIRTLSDELFGGGGDLAAAAQSTASAVSSTMDSLRDSMISALEGVRDWLDGQIFGDASSATPLERLNAAQSQFDQAIAAALGGDAGAVADLPGLADQLLGLASTFFGTSTDDFIDIEDQVRAAMESIAGMSAPGGNQPPTFAQTANIEASTESTAASAFEQAQLATQLVQQIALLSRITGDAPADIGEEFGIPIDRLIEMMTGELPGLTGDALGTYFDDLVGQVDDEIAVLLDLQAIQAAQVAHLSNIESILSTIAGMPGSMPEIATGPQPMGSGTPEIATGPDPISEAVATESSATREELRMIREELERISDYAALARQDDRELISETTGVAVAVRESGQRIRQAIEESRTSRRGPS